MIKRRLAVLALAFASLLSASDVYMSAHGKTYHTERNCMALSRATHVYTTDDKTAAAHGLTLCGICSHRHKGGKGKADKGAGAWAAPVAPQTEGGAR